VPRHLVSWLAGAVLFSGVTAALVSAQGTHSA
jgi:hypothetical protein